MDNPFVFKNIRKDDSKQSLAWGCRFNGTPYEFPKDGFCEVSDLAAVKHIMDFYANWASLGTAGDGESLKFQGKFFLENKRTGDNGEKVEWCPMFDSVSYQFYKDKKTEVTNPKAVEFLTSHFSQWCALEKMDKVKRDDGKEIKIEIKKVEIVKGKADTKRA